MASGWGRPTLGAGEVARLLACMALLSCTSSSPKAPIVLASAEKKVTFDEPARAKLSPTGPVQLSNRDPEEGGSAYRIVLEVSGDWYVSDPGEPEDKPPLSESHLLELEYREFPTAGLEDGRGAYLLGLDALHYKLLQQNPPARREIELGNDRLRVHVDDKEQMDLRGAQPKGDLTPQKLLGHIFAVVVHDEFGNPLAIAPRGFPVAKSFLENLLVKEAIGYSRMSLPEVPIAPGATWKARRLPASRSGALGLMLEVEYSLVAFEELDGVPCALILLRASEDGEGIKSATGLVFDRVKAKMTGSAWVELETSRVRRMVIEDEVRVALSRGKAPIIQTSRMRHATRMLLEARDPDSSPESWADGTTRFGPR